MQLRSLNDWVVKLLLLPIDGVTDVLSFGGEVRQYQVQLNPARILSYHLSPSDVSKAIAANNRNAGGWRLVGFVAAMTACLTLKTFQLKKLMA